MPFAFIFSTIFTWIRSALPWIAGALGATVSNWLVAAGFGVVVFSGFNVMTSRLIATAVTAFNDLNSVGPIGADILMLAGYMWLDKALNLIISAGAFLLALKGVREGFYARQAWFKPGQNRGGFEG